MDHTFHDFRDRLFQGLKRAIPSLPRGNPQSRLPRWAWILPLSLILAFWANQNSREEGKMNWLKVNPPSLTTWQMHLVHRGFSSLEDPAWREKAFAEMPDVGRKTGVALVSENRYTVAIRTDGDWLYFGLGRIAGSAGGQPVPRELWEPLGNGWEAVAHFDALELPSLSSVISKRGNAEWSDSRSLSY